jgi:hypothetical protein
MNNFKLLKADLDLTAIRKELASTDLWVDMDARPGRPPTQANSDRIQLRGNRRVAGKSYLDIHETIDLKAWHLLHHTRQFVLDFLLKTGGELGHVRVTNLDASAEIPAHIDVGEYCAIRDRYHLVINSDLGTLFTAGTETVTMHENEFWWFDNKKMHTVRNLGPTPRTHLVFDVLHNASSGASATRQKSVGF